MSSITPYTVNSIFIRTATKVVEVYPDVPARIVDGSTLDDPNEQKAVELAWSKFFDTGFEAPRQPWHLHERVEG